LAQNYFFEDFFKSLSALHEHFWATWLQKNWLGCQKLHYLCQMKHCEEHFLDKFELFNRFLTMCHKILKFWQVFFVRFVKTAFYVSTGTVSVKIVSRKIFQPSLDFERNLLGCLAKAAKQIVKTAFHLYK